MANYPTLKSGQVAMYGTGQTLAYNTGVVQFVNDSEHRWRGMPQLFRGTLAYAKRTSDQIYLSRRRPE